MVDPEYEDFPGNIARFAQLSGEDCGTLSGYLGLIGERRLYFKSMGATSTDHAIPAPAARTCQRAECERLYQGALRGSLRSEEAEQFRAQMLTEMALMSLDDDLVMQIHPGVYRNHNPSLFSAFRARSRRGHSTAWKFRAPPETLLDRVEIIPISA